MNKFIILGLMVTLFGITLDAFTVRSGANRQSLLSLFIMAIGCSIVAQVLSPYLTTLYRIILGGVLLIAGQILIFSGVKFPWFDLKSDDY